MRADAHFDGRGSREVPRWSLSFSLFKKRLGFEDAERPFGAVLAIGARCAEVPDAEPGTGAFVLVRLPYSGGNNGIRAAWATDAQEWGRARGLRWEGDHFGVARCLGWRVSFKKLQLLVDGVGMVYVLRCIHRVDLDFFLLLPGMFHVEHPWPDRSKMLDETTGPPAPKVCPYCACAKGAKSPIRNARMERGIAGSTSQVAASLLGSRCSPRHVYRASGTGNFYTDRQNASRCRSNIFGPWGLEVLCQTGLNHWNI